MTELFLYKVFAFLLQGASKVDFAKRKRSMSHKGQEGPRKTVGVGMHAQEKAVSGMLSQPCEQQTFPLLIN